MNRNLVLIPLLCLLCAAAGAVLEWRFGPVRASAPPDTAAAAPPPVRQAAQPVVPPDAAPPPEPSPADLETAFHAALDDREHNIERFFLDGDLIDSQRIRLLHADDDYEQFVEYLQTNTSPASDEHIAALQQSLGRQPQVLDGSVALVEMACGAALCTVALTARDAAAVDDYLATALRSPAEPLYVVMRLPMQTRGGAGARLVLSVDPTVKGATPAD